MLILIDSLNFSLLEDFAWQEGYGSFRVSYSAAGYTDVIEKVAVATIRARAPRVMKGR